MNHQQYEKYLEHLDSKEWRERQRDALDRAHWRCERCSGKRRLQVHHRTYARLFNEPPEDLEVLCESCHRQHHGYVVRPPSAEVKRAERIERKKMRKRDELSFESRRRMRRDLDAAREETRSL